MSTKDFVHLHVHSNHSLLDGVASTTKLLDRSKELGMRAIAITDHGTMGGHIEAQLEADRIGDIKVIFGIEAYVVDDHKEHSKEQRGANHILLLCTNGVGYANLITLNNIAWTDGFYYSPRIDIGLLSDYSDGLICLTACAKGIISGPAIGGNFEHSEKKLKRLKKIFKDRLFLEIQPINIDSEDFPGENLQEIVNKHLISLSNKHKISLVLTNDTHFIHKGDDAVQTALVRLQRADFVYAAPDNWLKTRKEMFRAWKKYCPSIDNKYFTRAANNTLKIADMCNYKIPADGFMNIPVFDYKNHPDYDGQEDKNNFFTDMLLDRLKEKGLYKKKKYIKRLDHECETIIKLGVVDYFLIVQDLFRYAKSKNILCHTRGSVNGSLVAFLLEFGVVDPIKHDILFERFLSPARLLTGKNDIDIDCDFEAEARPLIISYLKEKYGDDRICNVGTYSRLQLKAAIKDMARIRFEETEEEDFEFQKINSMTRTMYTSDFETELESNKEFNEFYENYKEWSDKFVLSIVGNPKSFSIHAAGLAILPSNVNEWLPIRTQVDGKTKERIKATAFENSHTGREDLFARGIMCLDVLGVKTLSIIANTIRDINDNHDLNLKFEDIPIDDEKTYKAFIKGETLGVFQLSAPKITSIIKKMKPDCFEDIIALISLDRPGPMMANAHGHYTDRKHDDEEITYEHPSLEPILKGSYGVAIYSEHLMKIATEFAGMSAVDGENLRKIVKAKDPVVFNAFKNRFIESAVKKWGIGRNKNVK